jgi:hypothetical protein
VIVVGESRAAARARPDAGVCVGERSGDPADGARKPSPPATNFVNARRSRFMTEPALLEACCGSSVCQDGAVRRSRCGTTSLDVSYKY